MVEEKQKLQEKGSGYLTKGEKVNEKRNEEKERMREKER